MKIVLGKTTVSLLNPPNEGQVYDKDGREWQIQRNRFGLIVLRPEFSGYCIHHDFINGMDLEQFCWWINQQMD